MNTPSLLPPKTNEQYGFFGYEGAMCDRAIRARNLPMLRECMDRGFMDADTEVIGFKNVVDFCEARGYPECAEAIRNHKTENAS